LVAFDISSIKAARWLCCWCEFKSSIRTSPPLNRGSISYEPGADRLNQLLVLIRPDWIPRHLQCLTCTLAVLTLSDCLRPFFSDQCWWLLPLSYSCCHHCPWFDVVINIICFPLFVTNLSITCLCHSVCMISLLWECMRFSRGRKSRKYMTHRPNPQ
jgi:hypothetical protein